MTESASLDGVVKASRWTTTIGAICEKFGGGVQTGPFGSQLHASDYSDDGTPVVMPQDMHAGRIVRDRIVRVSQKHVDRLHRHILREGDIVFSRRGDVSRFAVVTDSEQGWLCGTGSIRIRLNSPDISIRYVRHYLRQRIVGEWLEHHAKGVTMPNLNTEIIRALPFVYPPLSEQRRIAAILDKADEVRAKRRTALERLGGLTRSMCYEMFGNPSPRNSHWPVARLSEACEKISDGTHHSPVTLKEGIPYVTAKHIREDGIDFDSAPWFVSEADHRAIFSRCDPRPDDVLYIKDGATTGIAAVNRLAYQFSMLSSVALLRPRKGVINADYLWAWLNDPSVRAGILGNMAGAAIRRLTLVKIKRLLIPVPPISQQDEFARRLKVVTALTAYERRSLDEADRLFGSLEHRAFSGAL